MNNNELVLCPVCNSKAVKFGNVWSGKTKKQRYLCNNCGKQGVNFIHTEKSIDTEPINVITKHNNRVMCICPKCDVVHIKTIDNEYLQSTDKQMICGYPAILCYNCK